MAQLLDLGIFSVVSSSGAVGPGWKLYFYESGTTTPLSTYSDNALSVPNTNPVVSNANGRWPAIYLQPVPYKVILKDADDVTQVTRDPINSSPAFSQSPAGGAGSVTAKLQQWIDPRDAPYNAAGNDVANDFAALSAAFTAGAASGKWVDGGGQTYALSGNITLPAGLKLRNARFRQTSPNNATRKTLYGLNADNIEIENVHIDRDGSGTEGDLNSAGAFWFDGCDNLKLTDCSVTGDSKGTGIVVWNSTNAQVIRPHIYDMDFTDPSATDDVIQGVWFSGVTDGLIDGARVIRLGATGGAGSAVPEFPFAYPLSRAIVLGGCRGVRVCNGYIEDVDQMVDLTGSAGNIGCLIEGMFGRNLVSVGVKFANSAVFCRAMNIVIENVGYAGGIISGPTEAGLTYKTQDCVMDGFTFLNAGYNGHTNPNAGSAISIEDGDFDHDYPKGTKLTNILGIDTQVTPTMKFVVRNEVPGDDSTTGRLNELSNIDGYRYTEGLTSYIPDTADDKPFGFIAAKVNNGSDHSIPNNNETSLLFNNDVFDGAAMHDSASNTDRIYARRDGLYMAAARAAFDVNATGYRQLRIAYNDGTSTTADDHTTDRQAGSASISTFLSTSTTLRMKKGDYIEARVLQTSGGSLSVLAAFTQASLHYVGPM